MKKNLNSLSLLEAVSKVVRFPSHESALYSEIIALSLPF
jgi:hypothetical protein